MKSPFIRSFVLTARFAVACAITSASVRAAEPVPPPFAPTAAASTPAVSRPRLTAINVDFRGGSIVQLVAQLGEDTFNLIGEKALQETPLPAFSLRNTEASSMAVALNGLLRSSGLTISLAGPNIFVLTKPPPAPTFMPVAPTFQAYQLAPYLPTVSIDDITDAISAAWSSNPAHDPKSLTFKFHPATKLLFVYGPSEAITMATQIIPQLSPVATARAQRDYYAALPQVLPSTPSTNPADPAAEQARLDAVQEEVRRRRAQREAAGIKLPELKNK